MTDINRNAHLPLDSFTRLLAAIYGEKPAVPLEEMTRQNLGLGDTHSGRNRGALADAGQGLADLFNDINEAVAEDTGALLWGDINRNRLAEWMNDYAERVEQARENGLTDDTPEEIVETILHGDDTPEAVYGRRLVTAAIQGVRDGKRYNSVSDTWIS